jgi:Trk K+ transport system NAD-binding subunit
MVLGGGRVGLAAALDLYARGLGVVVVDKKEKRVPCPDIRLVSGDAADLSVLEEAGIRTAPSVIITTHDDDTNIYLTIYCRRLRPDIQIISRANLEHNVSNLHAAGADLVLSLVSMMTNSIVNMLSPGKVFMLNEGLNIFKVRTGAELIGASLADSGIRQNTHCNVVAVRDTAGVMHVNPGPEYVFAEGEELYLVGNSESESKYYARFGHSAVDDLLSDAMPE